MSYLSLKLSILNTAASNEDLLVHEEGRVHKDAAVLVPVLDDRRWRRRRSVAAALFRRPSPLSQLFFPRERDASARSTTADF